MAGGNEKRKNSWLDDQPYYMQSQQVMRERDWDTRQKYQNENMNRTIYENKKKEIQKRDKTIDMRDAKNRNRADLKEEGQDRAEIAKRRKQQQIADKLLNNRRKKNFNERLNKVKGQGDSAEKQGKLIPRELRHIQDYDYSQDNWDSGKLMDHKTRQGQNYQRNYLKNDANYQLERSKRQNKK